MVPRNAHGATSGAARSSGPSRGLVRLSIVEALCWAAGKSKVGLALAECASCLHVTVYPDRGWDMPFILSWMGSTAESNPAEDSLPAFLPNQDTPPAHTRPPSLGRCCLHSLRAVAEQGRGDSFHRWHYHFLMFHKKGKANFYLRVIAWSRGDHVPWDPLCSDGPLPLASGGRAGSGLE